MALSAKQATVNANGNLFEVKTVQSGVYRQLIEALKDILTEANLEFDQNGIKLVAVDESHTVLVYKRLFADRFEYFYCPKKYVLGINMIYFFKLIKTMGNNDSLTLFLPASNPNKLGIRIENTDKATVSTIYLKLFDTDIEDITIPSINYTSIIHMPSTDLQKVCRDLNALGEKLDVEIISSGTDLIFRCAGDFADQETIISENNSSMKVHRGTTTTAEIVQGLFQLKHLILFTKCTNLCPSVELYLKNELPLILKYTVGNLGEVKLILAPMKNQQNA